MACFPRLFNRRTKNSFNPAEDDNTDTILNSHDSSVQIGLYIRREETPVLTTKTSATQEQKPQLEVQEEETEAKQKPLQQQLSPQSEATNHINSNNHNNNVPKKFISNKNKSNSNSSSFRSNSNNNTNTNSNNNNSNNSSANHSDSKLKPVKERRPTALPTDAPELDEVTADEIVNTVAPLKLKINGSLTPTTAPSTPNTPTTPSLQNAKFFIGGSGDEINSKLSVDSNQRKTPEINGEPSSKPSYESHAFLAKSRFSSAASLSSIGGGKPHSSKHRRGSSRQPGAEVEEIHIPPPPPLPPQPLTTASSSASLASLKSGKRKGSNSAKALSSTRTSSTTNNKDFHDDLTHCTIAEVLNISNCNSAPTTVTNSLTERDSGVQVEYSAHTPKDSSGSSGDDTPKSHRLEGGLIYTRPNLPIKKDVEIEFIAKDQTTRNLIRIAIEKNDFLNNYMDKERKEMVIDAMSPATFERDSFIIREGDEGSEIFVSEEGTYEVLKGQKLIGNFGPATVFGELAILYNAPRFASIRVTSSARVWKIDREKFRKIMVISGSKEREENLNFLRSAPFLNDLKEDVLNKVVDLLKRKFYETNTCIVREGDVGNEFFIIRGGTVTIKKKNSDGLEQIVDRRKRGGYFGEQALLNDDRQIRQASVYADAPGTEVLKLDREAFISYLGTIPQLREKIGGDDDSPNGRVSNRKSEFDNEFAHICLTDLRKIATLGAGAFGRVDLVAHGNKTFALKIVKKIDIVKQDQVEHVYSEKHVMMKCSSSPFIIELYRTYRNEKFVYFLMEACMGGDVWTVMSQRRFFDEKTARFIAGCVVEAFDFLHSHNIIYRDLKPENLMLTTDGYCKLVDFGFAKHIPLHQKTNTFAGTPEYVAPEIILDRGHDRSVDYWALGILIFELLVGKTPFRGQNQIKIYQQILGGIDVIQMPSRIPKSAQGLIKQLCKQLPAERLGYQRRGILDIKRHSWFDNLDWNKLKNKQMSSPIKRPITSNTDLQYFGPPGVDNDQDPPDETSGWDIDF